jgi:putative transposase
MAKWIQMWKGLSSRRIAKAFEIAPPIWQADYFDRYLRSAENYSEKWDYVEQNPVRAGLVEKIDDWPYRGAIHELMF